MRILDQGDGKSSIISLWVCLYVYKSRKDLKFTSVPEEMFQNEELGHISLKTKVVLKWAKRMTPCNNLCFAVGVLKVGCGKC